MVGTLEGALDTMGMKREPLKAVEEPGLSDLDKLVIGKAIRIEIPFTDLYKLREIAGLLRGLADDIDFAARRSDHPPLDSRLYQSWRRALLFQLRFQATLINQRIRELHGKFNKNGTTK